MKKRILKLWWCQIWGLHDWTSIISALPKGEYPPIPEYATWDQVMSILKKNSTMYCGRCGKKSELNKQLDDIFK